MKKKLIFIFFVLLGSALSAGAVNTTSDRYRIATRNITTTTEIKIKTEK